LVTAGVGFGVAFVVTGAFVVGLGVVVGFGVVVHLGSFEFPGVEHENFVVVSTGGK
jgi:hypothetical protein